MTILGNTVKKNFVQKIFYFRRYTRVTESRLRGDFYLNNAQCLKLIVSKYAPPISNIIKAKMLKKIKALDTRLPKDDSSQCLLIRNICKVLGNAELCSSNRVP